MKEGGEVKPAFVRQKRGHLKMVPGVGTDLRRGELAAPPSCAYRADVFMVWGHRGTLIFPSHFFFIIIIVYQKGVEGDHGVGGGVENEAGGRHGGGTVRLCWAAP